MFSLTIVKENDMLRFVSKSSRPLLFLTLILALILSASSQSIAAGNTKQRKIPVILDTDIGDDIDDTWALVMMLNCPELDVKMIIGDNHNGIYRAKLIAKLLEAAGRTDIPVGMAYSTRQGGGKQSDWVKDYDLKKYPGKVYEDGVAAMIEMINKSPRSITIIAIGPVPNIAQALKRDPSIAKKTRFVGMHGSVRKGYGNSDKISAEYNVKRDVKACQAVFEAPWKKMTITPLDTCGIVHLRGDKYKKIRDSKDPAAKALLENYRIWRRRNPSDPIRDDEKGSSTLFDTVAVYLAFTSKLLKMETLPIRVDDKGFTVIDEKANKMRVATEWKDLSAFEDLLAERIVTPVK